MKKAMILAGLLVGSTISTVTTNATVAGKTQHVVASYVSSDYAKTKYPLVLTPGAMGFTRLGTAAIGIDYWYQILPDLAKNGSDVYALQVSPLNSTEVRGEQALLGIEEIIAITGAPKVNLIGHSHGGPTNVYVTAVRPDLIASMTTVGAPLRGAKSVDYVNEHGLLKAGLKIVLGYTLAPLATILEQNPDLPNDPQATLDSNTTAGAAAFNARYPTAAIPTDCNKNGGAKITNGIYNYSWIGNKPVTNILDVVDTAVSQIGIESYGNESHDGLVGACTSYFGQVIRDDYGLSHLDEVNQILGLKGFFAPDPVTLFRQHANRLKQQGL